jgi:hypothetical protein
MENVCNGLIRMRARRIDATELLCDSRGVPILQSARHERVAQLVASGKRSDMEAFKQAGRRRESRSQAWPEL